MNSIAKELILQTKRISLSYTYTDAITYTTVITNKDDSGNIHWQGSDVTITVTNKAATDINLTITDSTLTINKSYSSVLRLYTFTVHIPLNTSVDITTYQFNIVCSTGTTKQFNISQQGMGYINLPRNVYFSSEDGSIEWEITKSENGDGAVECSDGTVTAVSVTLDVPEAALRLVTVSNYTTSNSSGVTELSRTINANGTLYIKLQLNRTDSNFNSSYGIVFAYGDVRRLLDIKVWAHVEAHMKLLASPVVSLYQTDIGTYAKVQTLSLMAGIYKFECWGARGGRRGYADAANYGKGGYSVGTYTTYTDLKITIVAGCSGNIKSSSGTNNMPHNGGKSSIEYQNGGDASWICIGDKDDLYARVIVAGGGGSVGANDSSKFGGYGGGLKGESRTEKYGTGGFGGTQTGVSNASWQTTTRPTGTSSQSDAYAGFGFGGNGVHYKDGCGGAGGGGWYGGSGTCPDGSGDDDRGGGGGSGYVYTKSTASSYPSGCKLTSAHYLTDALTIAGNSTMPNWETSGGTITGNANHGIVRITKTHEYIKTTNEDIPYPERLSYIQNTGTGAIHLTNWYPSSQDASVSFDLLNGTQVNISNIFYFGGRSGTSNGVALAQSNGKWATQYNNTITTDSTITANGYKSGTIMNDGSTFTSNSYCVIFTININKIVLPLYTQYKFEALEVWQDNSGIHECVHRYVPAKNHEGIFGVLDLEGGGFYYDINNGNKYITGA